MEMIDGTAIVMFIIGIMLYPAYKVTREAWIAGVGNIGVYYGRRLCESCKRRGAIYGLFQEIHEPPEPVKLIRGSQCMGTTKAGNRCRRVPLIGSDYCSIHKGEEDE